MKITKNLPLLQKINDLLNKNELNQQLLNINLVVHQTTAVMINQMNPSFRAWMNGLSTEQLNQTMAESGLEKTQVFLANYLYSLINYFHHVDRNNHQPTNIQNEAVRLVSQISQQFTAKQLPEAEFYQKIPWSEMKDSRFTATFRSLKPYEPFIYDAPINQNGLSIPRLGWTCTDFHYPIVNKNDQPWLSLSPMVLETTQEGIKHARGNALILGVQIGYTAQMISAKPNVATVTIVESDLDKLQFFRQQILPHLPEATKIRIIEADPTTFMATLPDDGHYQSCFANAWDLADGLPKYSQLKQICAKFKRLKIDYWLEKFFLYQTRPVLEGILMVSLGNSFGVPRSHQLSDIGLRATDQPIFERLSHATKGVFIHNERELKHLLDLNNIAKLLEK